MWMVKKIVSFNYTETSLIWALANLELVRAEGQSPFSQQIVIETACGQRL